MTSSLRILTSALIFSFSLLTGCEADNPKVNKAALVAKTLDPSADLSVVPDFSNPLPSITRPSLPRLLIRAPEVLQFSTGPVKFEVDAYLPEESDGVKYRLEAFFPDESHPVTLEPTDSPYVFTVTSRAYDPKKPNLLTVQAIKEEEGQAKLMARQSLPLFLSGTAAHDSTAYLRVHGNLSASLRLHPSSVFKNSEALVYVDIKNSGGKKLRASLSLDQRELASIDLDQGNSQWEVLLPTLLAAAPNVITLQLYNRESSEKKNDKAGKSIAQLDLLAGAVDDSIPDGRFPWLTASQLQELFAGTWSPEMDPAAFIASWATPEFRFLAELYMISLGLLPGSCANGFVGESLAGGALDNGIRHLNCDDIDQLIVLDPVLRSITYLSNQRNGTYAAPSVLPAGSDPLAFELADLDGDAAKDIISLSRGSNEVTVLFGNPSACGTFKAPKTYAIGGTTPSSISVTDTNSDGRPDLVFANQGSHNVTVLYGRGGGRFSDPVVLYEGVTVAGAKSCITPDGKTNIVVVSQNNSVTVLGSSGSGTYQPSNLPAPVIPPNGIPMVPAGGGLGADYGPIYDGGPNGPGCSDLKRAFAQVLSNFEKGGLSKEEIENIFKSNPALNMLRAAALACEGKFPMPSLSCEDNREIFQRLTGSTIEDVILSYLPLPQELKDFIRPRFNVCSGLDLSGLNCRDMIKIAAMFADIVMPGVGSALSSGIGKLVAETLLCSKIDCNTPGVSLFCDLPNLPPVPDFDIDIDIDWSGCLFSCGGDDGSGGGSGGGWGGSWIPGSQPPIPPLFGNGGPGDVPPFTPDCSILPPNVMQMTFSELVEYAAQNHIDIIKLLVAVFACNSPIPVPGIPDVLAPVVTITTPVNGQEVTTATVIVKGTVDDTSSSVTVNGLPAKTVVGRTSLQFEVTIPTPSDGRIEARAVDAGGNVGTASISIVIPKEDEPFAILSLKGKTPCFHRNGITKCWGYNGAGTIGDGTKLHRLVPYPAQALPEGLATSLSSGETHTCAVVSGEVYCWGINSYGQVGNGTTVNTVLAEKVPNLTNVTSVSTGWAHSCALVGETVKCWGNNSLGMLGNGTLSAQSLIPVTVVGLNKPTIISAGASGTCAIDDGLAKCWGSNTYGELAIPTSTTRSAVALQVPGLATVQAISYGANFICAIAQGAVRCWGRNMSGQLGGGTVSPYKAPPVPVLGLESGATAVSAGTDHACAVKEGAAWCWGKNTNGQLGNGLTQDSGTPVPVTGLSSGVVSIEAGTASTCALLSTGEIKCWGANSHGEVGDDSTIQKTAPSSVFEPTEKGALSILAGGNHTCAVLLDGGLRCWGQNSSSELGLGTFDPASVPHPVTVLDGVPDGLALGDRHSCALINGGVSCWGADDFGQLGVGSYKTGGSPIPVSLIALGSGVTSLSAGANHSCAIADGGVQCWGSGGYGRLGNNSTTDSPVPVQAIGLQDGVSALEVGAAHSCAVMDEALYCWGTNSHGQLGNLKNVNSTIPVRSTAITGSIGPIAIGVTFTCAVLDESIKCWGRNVSGSFGNGSLSGTSYTPVAVVGLSGQVTSLSASGYHVCAVVDGGAYCWGDNDSGTLGDGSQVDSPVPVPVLGLNSGVKSVTVGYRHSCALLNSGAVKCWGGNTSLTRELGVGWLTGISAVPMGVVGLSP